jgi:hypothetical protein
MGCLSQPHFLTKGFWVKPGGIMRAADEMNQPKQWLTLGNFGIDLNDQEA